MWLKMSNWQDGKTNSNSSGSGNEKINPDSYLDIGIKSILNLPSELMQKENSFDVDKYMKMKVLLTEQLENIAIAMRKVKPMQQPYDSENLSESQKKLRMCLVDYFKENNLDIGVGSVPKADSVMRFILEGAYSTRIDLMREKLEKEVLEKGLSSDVADAQLANYKLRLIVGAVNNSKVRVVDIDA
jgi:hypothetical protein